MEPLAGVTHERGEIRDRFFESQEFRFRPQSRRQCHRTLEHHLSQPRCRHLRKSGRIIPDACSNMCLASQLGAHQSHRHLFPGRLGSLAGGGEILPQRFGRELFGRGLSISTETGIFRRELTRPLCCNGSCVTVKFLVFSFAFLVSCAELFLKRTSRACSPKRCNRPKAELDPIALAAVNGRPLQHIDLPQSQYLISMR
ncbi:hypothetical protein D9M72_444530 [compost metagenome]